MPRRRVVRQMQRSGLPQSLLSRCTFARFEATEPWQKAAKAQAMAFVDSKDGWMLATGQVGAGKSHLCVAACGALLDQGASVYFFSWREQARELKAMVNEPEYDLEMQKIKRAAVLYIDDFFKSGDKEVTAADKNLAFEIINSRYAAQKRTMISTELSMDKLLAIDEAIGSRIYEMSKHHWIDFAKSATNRRVQG